MVVTASPGTQLRALRSAARRVVEADARFAATLNDGTIAEERRAQRDVWAAIQELAVVLRRYDRRRR